MNKKKFSPQTLSFIILFAIAIIGTYVSLNVAGKLNRSKQQNNPQSVQNEQTDNYKINSVAANTAQAKGLEPEQAADTTNWKTFTDEKYKISFKINPDWQVKATGIKDGFYVIEVDPGKKFYNIKIYISQKGYFALDGLPGTEEAIGGQKATNINNVLFGVKKDNYYYTFDIGLSMSLKPQFLGLVRSVTFSE